MTRPARLGTEYTYVTDFVVSCGAPKAVTKGQPCTTPARWATAFHMCGQCTHPSLTDGCIERFVCDDHLESLENEAARTARKYRRQPFFIRWFRGDSDRRCESCHTLILHPGDVLQIVQGI